MGKKATLAASIPVFAICWMVGAAFAPPRPTAAPVASSVAAHQQHQYVGARDGCRRCHLREYRSWEDTPHASALETLEGDDAANPECLRCHVTGWGEPTGYVTAEETPQLAGVTCESCHGPGSDYRDRDVMKDLDASLAAGMWQPDEQTCRGCHNEESPTFPGEFVYEEMKERGIHSVGRSP